MELTGTVKAIIYRSEDTGFTVLELTNEAGEDMTAIGEMPLAGVGERVELTGQWTEHKTYGRQFRAETCKTLAPATLTALKNYLASGLIKGVGESTAQAIVQTFGMGPWTCWKRSRRAWRRCRGSARSGPKPLALPMGPSWGYGISCWACKNMGLPSARP